MQVSKSLTSLSIVERTLQQRHCWRKGNVAELSNALQGIRSLRSLSCEVRSLKPPTIVLLCRHAD